MNSQPVKLLDQGRNRIRVKHYSIRTEEAYVSWIRRFILFYNKRHPKEMGGRVLQRKGTKRSKRGKRVGIAIRISVI